MVTHSQGVFQKDTLHDSQGKDVATVAVGGKKKKITKQLQSIPSFGLQQFQAQVLQRQEGRDRVSGLSSVPTLLEIQTCVWGSSVAKQKMNSQHKEREGGMV